MDMQQTERKEKIYALLILSGLTKLNINKSPLKNSCLECPFEVQKCYKMHYFATSTIS
jgi:hypothetical protein